MKYCRDCRKKVREFEIYCPHCSSDLYARPQAPQGLLEALDRFELRVR